MIGKLIYTVYEYIKWMVDKLIVLYYDNGELNEELKVKYDDL